MSPVAPAGSATSSALLAAATRLPDLAASSVTVQGMAAKSTTLSSIRSGASGSSPTLARAIPDQQATEGSRFHYQIPASTFSGNNLYYTARVQNTTASWLSFNNTTRTFSGSVPQNAPNLTILVTVYDRSGQWNQDRFVIRTPARSRKDSVDAVATRLSAALATHASNLALSACACGSLENPAGSASVALLAGNGA